VRYAQHPDTPRKEPRGMPKGGASAKSVSTPAPRLRPAGGALADLREGLHAVQAPSEKPRQVPRHTQKTASGSAYASASANSPRCHTLKRASGSGSQNILRLSLRRLKRNYLCTGLQAVQIIRPRLHHLPTTLRCH